MVEYDYLIKQAGEVQKPRLGERFVGVMLTEYATDLLCKAISFQLDHWQQAGHEQEETKAMEQLHKEAVALWELFRP